MDAFPCLQVVEQLGDVVWQTDGAYRFTNIGAADERMRGYPARVVLGQPLFAWMEPNTARDAKAAFEKLSAGAADETVRIEAQQRRHDRSLLWTEIRAIALRDASGKITGFCGITRDLSDAKHAENAFAVAQIELTYERDLFMALLDASPDAIYFKDLQSRIVRMSRSKALKLIDSVPKLRARYAEDPSADPVTIVHGITDFDTYAKQDAQAAYDDEQTIIRTGKPLVNKLEKQVFQDGSFVWYLTHKLPWRDRNGKIVGTFGVSKDVTDLKEAEQALEKVTKELVMTSRFAGMAEVATGVLHNVGNAVNSLNVSVSLTMDRLRQSRLQQLEKVVQLVEQHHQDLAGFLASDERGSKVVPYLKALATTLVEERNTMLDELEETRKSVDHIKEIVAMQQAYATTAGAIEPVLLREVVEDAIQMHAAALQRHEIELTRKFAADPSIATDRHKVLQILVNVLHNAKYACDTSGQSAKRIEVSIAAADGTAEIAVTDNGVGIAPENMTKIFTHGFTTRKGGHGFGLHNGAIAAKELGGSLTAESPGAGRGATFRLKLPLAGESHS